MKYVELNKANVVRIAAVFLLAAAAASVCIVSVKNARERRVESSFSGIRESETRRTQGEAIEGYTSISHIPTASTTARVIDAPYVGMREGMVDETLLGRPDAEVRHNIEIKGFDRFTANLYDFTRDGRVVFTARCVDGWVTEIWDRRDEKYATTTWHVPKTTAAAEYDRYDVYDYRNAEDFYYDHYDDFFDYYDAENYFNDHRR